MRRYRFSPAVNWLDEFMHAHLAWLPQGFLCDLRDWCLGMTWREARS